MRTVILMIILMMLYTGYSDVTGEYIQNRYDSRKTENQESSSTSSDSADDNAHITYYKHQWDDAEYIELDGRLAFSLNPIIVVGDNQHSTVIFYHMQNRI